MKNKAVILGMAVLLMSSATFAQETDDMYFTSKDRAKLKAKQAQEEAAYAASIGAKYGNKSEAVAEDNNSYSARNENPEFAARSNAQTASEDNQDYFVNDYQYQKTANLNKFNNSYGNWSNSSMYAANYYGPSIYGWNSPYYGSAYDSWGNPWMNPYYRSGWSSSFSFYWGNSYNYGWGGSGLGMGMGYGYANPYMNSWYGWGSPYYNSGFGFGGNGWYGGYPSNIIVINNGDGGGRNVAYGKRASHGGMVTSRQDAVNSRTRSSSYTGNTGDNTGNTQGIRPYPGATGGRVSTDGRMPSTANNNGNVRSHQQEDYYNRSWRGSQQQGGTYSAPSRGSSNGSWSQPSRSSSDSWNRGGNSNNGGFSNPSLNNNSGRSSGSFDGGTRSSGSGGGGGSNGRSRGRD